MTCCGKGMHIKCRGKMNTVFTDKLKSNCVMCGRKKPYEGPSGYVEVILRLREWVGKGESWAQVALGQMYEHGNGVDQSYKQARKLYELSAVQGNVNAQFRLGFLHKNGKVKEGPRDEVAKYYYELAAHDGMADAQTALGIMFSRGFVENGKTVQSNETAREWFMKAAKQGQEIAIKQIQLLDIEEGRTTPSLNSRKNYNYNRSSPKKTEEDVARQAEEQPIKVQVHSLTSEKGKRLNGLTGVRLKFNKEEGRYEVKFKNKKSLWIKKENLNIMEEGKTKEKGGGRRKTRRRRKKRKSRKRKTKRRRKSRKRKTKRKF